LDNLDIQFEFFDAVDGRAEPPHPLFDNYDYAKRLWLTSGRMPSKGELGCYASHYLLWKSCVELDEPFVILEDDVEVSPRFKDMRHLIEKKVVEYGFLRLQDKSEKGVLIEKESGHDYSISFMTNNFGGLIGYAIAPNSARKLLSKSKSWCMPVDNYVGSLYLHNMPSYVFYPSIVAHPYVHDTTIQLGEEKKAKWHRKLSRELYSLYRKIKMTQFNKKYQ
jgi:glycosyl transferase family 25